jgi:putative transposase
VVDDFTRECLALVVDTSLSSHRVAREFDALIALRGRPLMVVSDNVQCREALAAFGQQISMRRRRSALHAI